MSSPRTRGSSPGQRGCSGSSTVVPAHAGVIRGGCRVRPGLHRRPRARGGHPRIRSLTSEGVSSSPRTRGSSLELGRVDAAVVVVPAHAGVIRGHRRPGVRRRRRPRARGGHPQLRTLPKGPTGSSPRTRGSSAPRPRAPPVQRVVPAHAGVIPGGATTGRAGTCRPRARGGHADVLVVAGLQDLSSPRTRGSSPFRRGVPARWVVVPAHAGVILRDTGSDDFNIGRPRARGGHPVWADRWIASKASSPRTRGSSDGPTGAGRSSRVVPAHAGVIPHVAGGRAGRHGRPRARGGHPSIRCSRTAAWTSSPRTRGSSGAGLTDEHHHHVVPAHAGVIRRSAPGTAGRWSRPRARGGHPSPLRYWSRPLRSSPRTRGSSGRPGRGRRWDGVVPAHAGVIRHGPSL